MIRGQAWSRPAAGGPLLPRPVDLEPGPGEVIVEVAGCGLGRKHLWASEAVVGRVPGDEVSGRVVAVGPDLPTGAAASLEGQPVVLPRVWPCGECAICLRGRTSACPAARHPGLDVDGGYATHLRAPARWALPITDDLNPDRAPLWQLAPLGGPILEGLHAVARAEVAPGEPVIVVGIGTRALCTAAVARAKGARVGLFASRPAPAGRLELGRALGFTVDLDPLAVRQALTAEGAAGFGVKLFETTGTTEGLARALELAEPAGLLVVMAAAGVRPVDLERLLCFDVPILPLGAAHPDLLTEAAALRARGELKLEPLWQPVPFGQPGDQAHWIMVPPGGKAPSAASRKERAHGEA